ncbi:MAG: hypothetical protein H7306_24260 [Bacteriovorax sp.]|nr:hypothetical protein [Rhizobacter sp.]
MQLLPVEAERGVAQRHGPARHHPADDQPPGERFLLVVHAVPNEAAGTRGECGQQVHGQAFAKLPAKTTQARESPAGLFTSAAAT